MKKIASFALAVIMTASVMGSQPALAVKEDKENKGNTNNDENKVQTTDYMKATGTVSEIESSKEETRVTLENNKEIVMILKMKNDSLIFESGKGKSMKVADLKKGSELDVYYDKNKPMILIYPTTLTPELVIVKNNDVFGEVKVSKFDEEYLSLDGQLKLNIGPDTVLVDQYGKAISEKELKNEELVVFYSATTRSIPAQTSPTKIMTLDLAAQDDADRVQAIIASDYLMKDGVKMIPLRKVAEQLGYKVQSVSKINGALVTKQNLSYTITRGEKMYGYNKSIAKFEVAPFLKDMKTYVPESFLNELLEN